MKNLVLQSARIDCDFNLGSELTLKIDVSSTFVEAFVSPYKRSMLGDTYTGPALTKIVELLLTHLDPKDRNHILDKVTPL